MSGEQSASPPLELVDQNGIGCVRKRHKRKGVTNE